MHVQAQEELMHAMKFYNFVLQRGEKKEVIFMNSWKCGNCGYTLEADTPPDKCPACKEQCEFLNNTCYIPDCAENGVDHRIG